MCCSLEAFLPRSWYPKHIFQKLRNKENRDWDHFNLELCRDVKFSSSICNDIRTATCDFQQCGILTSVDSDEHVQPPFKLRNSK